MYLGTNGEGEPGTGTLEDFIAWLETKPPNEYYTYPDPAICPCRQYLDSLGVKGLTGIRRLDDLALGNGSGRDWTFGKLLSRARVALLRLTEAPEGE